MITSWHGECPVRFPVDYDVHFNSVQIMPEGPEKAEEKLSESAAAAHGLRSKMTHWPLWMLTVLLLGAITANIYLIGAQLQEVAETRRERAFWTLCHRGATPEDRARMFLQLAAEGNSEWRSALLDNLALQKIDLSASQLGSATFSACDFTKAIFADADLTHTAMERSDLSDCDFRNAKLRNATFFKSTLSGADFRNTDLLSASFEQVTAHGSAFIAAKLGDAFFAMADVTGSDFTGADLSGANLEAAIFRKTDLALANLYGTQTIDADFTDSNWWRARGLGAQQLDEFTLRFPPTTDSSESRQRDFEIWLSKRLEDPTQRRPPSE